MLEVSEAVLLQRGCLLKTAIDLRAHQKVA